MTSPTQRAGADVQRLRAVVVRNGAMVYPHLEDDANGNLVTYSDYAALQARIAELEKGIKHRGDDVVVPLALWEEMDRVGLEWKRRAEAAEARNAASERLLKEARPAVWHAMAAAVNVPIEQRMEDLLRRIDAHAQGQAGEEK